MLRASSGCYERTRDGPTQERMAVSYYLGKFLELNGMVLLGFGLFWGVVRDDVRGEIAMLGFGAALFLAGYWVERRTSGRN